MKNKTCFSVLAIALTAIFISAMPTHAQIVWGPATNVGNDSDVQTNGTYFDAALVLTGANGGNPLTVNGVQFNLIAAGTSGALDPSGDIELTSPRNAASGVPSPDHTATAAYNTLLESPVYSIGPTQTLTLNNLVVGHTYQVEVWSATGGQAFLTDLSGTTPVTLNALTLQYAVGTFVASSTTFSFSATASVGSAADASILNAVSVFDESGGAVPEPSTYALLFAGLLTFGLVQSRRRRNQTF